MNNGLSLKNRNIVYVKEPIEDGFIFKKANFAKDWDSVYVYPENLHRGTVSIGMRKITQPLLVLASHSAKMAFIVASEESPVYVPFCFENTKGRNFFMLFQLLPPVLPDYFFYLSKYSSWIPITMHIEQNEIFGNPGWNEVGSQIALPEIPGAYDTIITAEDIFYSGLSDNPIIIPELDVQKQRIADAKSVEIMLQEKVQEKETRYVRMEWLNEAHIRNCKHRLSNDMFPLRMAIDSLYNFFVKNPEGVKLSDIIGIRTKNTVAKLFDGIKESIEKVSNEIEYLTQSEDIEKKKERINVAKELNNNLEKIKSKFSTVPFNVRKIGFDSDLQIEIAKEAFTELLNNIIDNAVRHGFVEQRDYIIEVSIEVTENDMCRISIANNGRPMSERAIKTYFEHGSSAGDTSHTGLGGARIYSICDKMGGKALDPSSKEGFPVVISVEFPIVEVD